MFIPEICRDMENNQADPEAAQHCQEDSLKGHLREEPTFQTQDIGTCAI